MALPKNNRIGSKKDIDRIFKNGRTVKGSSLFIRFARNEKRYPRFVFIVPTKYIPLAVDRNKVKRILSAEIARSFLGKEGYDIVVGISKKTARDRFNDLVRELNELLPKI